MAKDDSPGAEQFARDFGYLAKFLQAVTGHAGSLPGPRGERLRALLDGEIGKWDEIHRLLTAGDAPPVAAPAPSKPAASVPAAARSAARPASVPMGLTVGSLLRDRRRPGE